MGEKKVGDEKTDFELQKVTGMGGDENWFAKVV